MFELFFPKKFSLDEAFGFSSSFLNDLWKHVIKTQLGDAKNAQAFDNHSTFCNLVAGNPRSSPEWIQAVSSVTVLSGHDVKEAQLSWEDVFLSMMEYCRIFHERWNGALEHLLLVLRGMKDDSGSHLPEWQRFQRTLGEFIHKSPREHCHLSIGAPQPLPQSERDILGELLIGPVSIEGAHSIAIMFLMKLHEFVAQKAKTEKIDTYEYFHFACCMHEENSHEWFRAVASAKDLREAEEQRRTQFTPSEIFLCTIAFCKRYNEEFGGQLQDLINLLEAMPKEYDHYPQQWACWQEAVFQYAAGSKIPLDWQYWPEDVVLAPMTSYSVDSSASYWQTRGHFTNSTEFHEQCILQATSCREHLIGIKFDEKNNPVELYTTTLTQGPYSGCQVWAEVVRGTIINGGIHYAPKSWRTDFATYFGGESVPLRYLPHLS